jgi:hypothetical protein
VREFLREITTYQASIKCAAYFLNLALSPKSHVILQLLQQKYLFFPPLPLLFALTAFRYQHGVPASVMDIFWSPIYLWQRLLKLAGVQVAERAAKPDSSWQV